MNARLLNYLVASVLFFSSISVGNAAVVNAVTDAANNDARPAKQVCKWLRLGGSWVKVCWPVP